MTTKEFTYGPYFYEYALIPQERKTLSLTVQPDMSIVVKCPTDAPHERVEIFLRKKWMWLNKQLHFFEKFQKTEYEKEYISGESFLYLGRQYQLIVKRAKEEKVSLSKGKLFVFSANMVSDGKYNKVLVETWYEEKTRAVFNERYEEILQNFGYDFQPSLVVRKMDKRWGSFTNDKKLVLNPRLIHASKECIDYVIAHELCHLRYKNHDKRFYNLLTSKIPEWEKIKEKLELRIG